VAPQGAHRSFWFDAGLAAQPVLLGAHLPLFFGQECSVHISRRTGISVNFLLASVCALVPLALGQQKNAPSGIQKIDHVVFLIKENRAYDNMFGAFNSKYGRRPARFPQGRWSR
jgi:phospholipase C